MKRRNLIFGTAAGANVPSISARAQDSTPSPSPGNRVISPVEVLITGFDSPEGPAFDKEGNLFFVNWRSSAIHKLTREGNVSEFFTTGGIPAGLAFHPDGSLYVADEGETIHGILRITPDGESSIVVNEFEGAPLNGSNDLVFDRNGVLFFSDPWDSPDGGFYRYFPDGKLEQLDNGLAFPNGVALTADEDAVILAESGQNRLLRYPIAVDGTIGEREIWSDLDGSFSPDGMAFDVNGDLYLAHYGSGHIDVIGPDGTTVDQIDIPGQEPTNLAFGGPDNMTLVITDVATASLYTVRLSVAGQPPQRRPNPGLTGEQEQAGPRVCFAHLVAWTTEST